MKATRQRLAAMPREKREYLLVDLPRLLVTAGNTDQLQDILTDFEFLGAKLEFAGPDGLIEDYALANDPFPGARNVMRLDDWTTPSTRT